MATLVTFAATGFAELIGIAPEPVCVLGTGDGVGAGTAVVVAGGAGGGGADGMGAALGFITYAIRLSLTPPFFSSSNPSTDVSNFVFDVWIFCMTRFSGMPACTSLMMSLFVIMVSAGAAVFL